MSRQKAESEKPNEKAMQTAFKAQIGSVLSKPDRFQKNGRDKKVGIEIEFGIIEKTLKQSSEQTRNHILDENKQCTDIELGACQIEMRTDPLVINNDPLAVLDELKVRQEAIQQSAIRQNVFLISSGTNPFIPTNEIVRTTQDKYRLVPNYHNKHRRPFVGTSLGRGGQQVDVGDAAVVGLTNSVQANIEAVSFEDAVDKLNRSFQIGPMLVAVSGNARFLDGKDTGIQDLRMIAWEFSHDTRTPTDLAKGKVTRIGLPKDYYGSIEDYFQQILEYPFILNAPQAALPIGIGLNWRDTRIKIIEDSLVVEFRPVSTQPTTEENFATMMFYVGRLLWSQQTNEQLISMNKIRENRSQSMAYGTHAKLWTRMDNGDVKLVKTGEAIRLEKRRALDGFKTAGITSQEVSDALEILVERANNGNPSEKLARLREKFLKRDYYSYPALADALKILHGMR